MAVFLDVQNLLNDRYYVTLLNAQGNHYAPPRLIDVGIDQAWAWARKRLLSSRA